MIVHTFDEYNSVRRGRERISAKYQFVMGEAICGLCKNNYIATEQIFLICHDCLERKVGSYPGEFSNHVYGLYNMSDECVYIGVTNNPIQRVHDHMLSKNFKCMKIIRSFHNRVDADDFEKFSIANLRPTLNILIEDNWSRVPDRWSHELFGVLASKKVKTHSKKPVQVTFSSREICIQCNQPIGKNKPRAKGPMHMVCNDRLRGSKNSSPLPPKKKKFWTECFECKLKVDGRMNLTYVKDSRGNRAVFHTDCLEKIRKK